MAKGGARARSGPPPDPNSLRSAARADGIVTLPAEGRVGDLPDWPLSEQTEREAIVWARQWVRPQAIMWERNGQAEEVAMFVRAFCAAESAEASAAERVLVVRMQEYLGLSVPGLARNQWRIAERVSPADQPAPAPTGGPAQSARERLRVVKSA